MSITKYQKKKDYFIYNSDDETLVNLLQELAPVPEEIPISRSAFDDLLSNKEGGKLEFNLLGIHNQYNVAMAIQVCKLLELSDQDIELRLKSFYAIEHRLELVGEIDEVKFINDSKATNIDAVYYALDGIDAKIHWIVGGVDKGNDYEQLKSLVESKVKSIIILSKFPEKIQAAFGDSNIPIFHTENTKIAVEYAKDHSASGEVVLLSPACASFDLYKNYEERGERFKSEVFNLKKKKDASNPVC